MSILLREFKESAVQFTLNRPEVLNALSSELAEALASAVNDMSNRKDVRCIVIRGAGGKAFCAGTDLKERRHLNADEKWAQSRKLWTINQALLASPKPIIAAIDGWCLGGGFELALFCDLRLATDSSVFGWPEMTLGAYPGSGAAVMLPRLIGPSATKKMMFATHRNSAAEVEALGLLNWLVPKEKFETSLSEIIKEINRRSPLALAALKEVIARAVELPFEEAMRFDHSRRRPLEATKDYQEGITAHFEKRQPVFTGD